MSLSLGQPCGTGPDRSLVRAQLRRRGSLVLAPLWPRFMAKYPDVELDIALIDRVVDIVEEGYDLAIRISRTPSGNHIARRLGRSSNMVCASPAYLAAHGIPRCRRIFR